MNESSRQMIIAAASRAYPREACGLVWDDEAVEFPNVAKDGTQFFIMDRDAAQVETDRRGVLPSGIWHSHPNGDPTLSESDILYAPPGYRMYLVAEGKVIDHGCPG